MKLSRSASQGSRNTLGPSGLQNIYLQAVIVVSVMVQGLVLEG